MEAFEHPEDVIASIPRDADAVVGHCNDPVAVLQLRGDLDARRLVRTTIFDGVG